MYTKLTIKTTLQKYHLAPNRLLGQNFLISRPALNKIIAAAELTPSDVVLEVGPGLGVLTLELAKYAGKVIAVEKDKNLAEVLGNSLKEQKIKNVEIIQGDILRSPILNPEINNLAFENWDLFENWKLKIENYKVVANIPYYLTSNLIRRFLEIERPPSLMVLMLQKEVAQRICGKPPQMSLLAVATQFYADVKIIASVPKASFWPQPKVDSAIIKITPTNSPPWKGGEKEGVNAFFRLLHAGFSQPRKQLANNLNRELKIDRPIIEAALKKIGLEPKQRAETLSVEDWKKLNELLEKTAE